MTQKTLEEEVKNFDSFISEFPVVSFWINHYQNPCRNVFRDGDKHWEYSKKLSPDFYERQLKKLLIEIKSPALISKIQDSLSSCFPKIISEVDQDMDDLELAYFWISHLSEGEIYSSYCNPYKQENFFLEQSKKACQKMSNIIPKQMLGKVIYDKESLNAMYESSKESGNEMRDKKEFIFGKDLKDIDIYFDIFAKKLREKLKKIEKY